MDIYDIDELGPTTGTVFQMFANNNQAIKINTLFDTGAMKSVMSLEMYKKLKLDDQMRNKHQQQAILPDFYHMQTPKKTDYPR